MAEDKPAQQWHSWTTAKTKSRIFNATVKSLSKMSVHQEGAHEAEEELDELHTENETPRSRTNIRSLSAPN
jgi:hypothetical protein